MTWNRRKIAVIGNDYGGAMYLDSVLPRLSSIHNVLLVASGPALGLWKLHDIPIASVGERNAPALKQTLLTFGPDLVVTGTSHYSELERMSWIAAYDLGIPSLGIVDAWANLPERFIRLTDQTMVYPSAVAMIDTTSRDALRRLLGENVRCHVTGHPHLEGIVRRHTAQTNRALRAETPKVTFFSNPVCNDAYALHTHKDQFDVVETLLSACLVSPIPVKLWIKPHPREETQRWIAWAQSHRQEFDKTAVSFCDDPSEILIEKSDVICGITSMALVEAVLMGKPVHSIQLSRKVQTNPILDSIDNLVVSSVEGEVARDLAQILADLQAPPLPNSFAAKFDNSAHRLIDAIEVELSLR